MRFINRRSRKERTVVPARQVRSGQACRGRDAAVRCVLGSFVVMPSRKNPRRASSEDTRWIDQSTGLSIECSWSEDERALVRVLQWFGC